MNILTFDIEEWFHLLDNESTKTINEWKNYEVRIHQNMERIFKILECTNTRATFFCLGWIAETYPEVVKEIVARGYEVGTHTRMHQLVYEQTPTDFEQDLEYSIKTLEDITGQKVKYFRAPGFSITENEKWAFEILVKHGIEVDCSIFPAPRAHGGFPSYNKSVPSIIKYNGIELKELPVSYTSLAGKSIIFSGGGYFRLFPYPLIKKWTKEADYVMSYLHPRDFDAEQPIIKQLSAFRKFKSYVGLKSATSKLEKWLTDFEFLDIQTAEEKINWNNVPVVELQPSLYISGFKINIGTGRDVSIKQVAELIKEKIGFKGELYFNTAKPDGTLKKLTDPSKIHALGWHHKIEIDEGIEKMYNWYIG